MDAPEPPALRHVPAIAKHPDARLIPFTAEVVPVPPRSVVVPIAKPNSDDGVVEPIPIALLALMRKTEVVAEPEVLVDEAISKSAWSELPLPWKVNLAMPVVVPFTTPPAKIEVAVVEVAIKFWKTPVPATLSFAYGDVVPIPTLRF